MHIVAYIMLNLIHMLTVQDVCSAYYVVCICAFIYAQVEVWKYKKMLDYAVEHAGNG